MPGRRSLAVGLALGVAIGVYLETALRWPTFLSVGIGAVMALIVLLIAASVGDDPEAADAAWRAEAPDLVVRRRGPGTESIAGAVREDEP